MKSFPDERSLPQTARLTTQSGFASERGGRSTNEDYVGVAGPLRGRCDIVAAIADGVGGRTGGRIAAELSVRTFIDGYIGLLPTLPPKQASMRSLEAANRWIHSIGRSDLCLQGMATTFTALICEGRHVHVVHVGDSRLYRLRDGRLHQLTVDHSAGPGQLNVLTRAVGADDEVRVDYMMLPNEQHDRYFLCTDGVSRGLSEKILSGILNRRASADDTCREIVDLAISTWIGDNATALIVDILDLPAAEFSDDEAAISSRSIVSLPQVGSLIDNFRIEALLSDSRYVSVFKAIDQTDERLVVLKFPKPLKGADRPMREAFLREMWIASRIRSPFVTEVLRLQEDRPTCLYLAMPFYEGETLDNRLRRRPAISLTTGLDIAQKLAKGVAAAHRAGVVHRDLKPENVILCSPVRGQPASLKIVDFGLARRSSEADESILAQPGTPSFMAPELFTGAPADEKSDQFALGVTIYRLFTGKYPYGEVEPFSRPRFGAPVTLSTYRSDLPSWLGRAIARSIAVDPNDRYADVLELLFEIEHGADRAAPLDPQQLPLYQRNPLRFWKVVSALLTIGVVLLTVGLVKKKQHSDFTTRDKSIARTSK